MLICDDLEPEANVFPSAGMTLLRNIPTDLANRVRAALTFRNPDFKPPRGTSPAMYEEAQIRLWAPHEEGTLVPRYYWHPELAAYGRVELVVGDVGDFHHVLQFPPRENQLQVTQQLDRWDGDVNINGPCAYGKTFVSFYYAAKTPGRILIIVPNNNKMDEWRREAMRFLGLRADQVGTIQGSRRDWRGCPVVIAMSKTLAVQEFDHEIATSFASVISDETHLASAPIISRALGKIGGKRTALTATPGGGLRREIIEFHFGRNWISPRVPRMPTRYEFLPVPVWERLRKMDWDMQRTMVGRDEFYSSVAARVCSQLMAQGRRVLVLGNQIEPLMHVHKLTGKVGGFVVGVESLDRIAMTFGEVRLHLEGRTESRKKDRAGGYMAEVKASMNPILGIGLTKTQPAGTGMDVEDLDGGVIMLPIGGRDTVTQIRGRYERVHPTKKNPLVVVMFPDTDSGRDTAEAMAAHLRAGDAEVVFHEPMVR